MSAEYVELHARSAFSFLRAASLPEFLAEKSAELGLPAVGLCDRDGVYGAPRFHAKAKEVGIRPIVGAELTFADGHVLPVLVENRVGYRNLCRLITTAKLRGTKHEAPLHWADLEGMTDGLIALTGDEEGAVRRLIEAGELEEARAYTERLKAAFGDRNVCVEVQRHLRRGEEWLNGCLFELAKMVRLPVVATNGVLFATVDDRTVLDVFICAREHTHLDAAGKKLTANGERHLKDPRRMRALFPDHPRAVTNTLRVAERLEFTLKDLGYEFPKYPVSAGETMDTFLRKVTMRMKLKLTQEALAEQADISHRYLQSIEAGKKQPSINVVSRLRGALRCKWEELLRGV